MSPGEVNAVERPPPRGEIAVMVVVMPVTANAAGPVIPVSRAGRIGGQPIPSRSGSCGTAVGLPHVGLHAVELRPAEVAAPVRAAAPQFRPIHPARDGRATNIGPAANSLSVTQEVVHPINTRATGRRSGDPAVRPVDASFRDSPRSATVKSSTRPLTGGATSRAVAAKTIGRFGQTRAGHRRTVT